MKPQSIGMHKRQNEFENPLASHTVDLQHMAILQNPQQPITPVMDTIDICAHTLTPFKL